MWSQTIGLACWHRAAGHHRKTQCGADNGVAATDGSAVDLIGLIAAETARWRKVVKEIGVNVQTE